MSVDPLQASSPIAQSATVRSFIDEFTPRVVRGWALNFAAPGEMVCLHVLVDGRQVDTVDCSGQRPDVLAHGLGSEIAGFSFRLDARYFDGRNHTMEFRLPGGEHVGFYQEGQPHFEHVFAEAWYPAVKSNVDGLHEGKLKGWVLVRSDDHWVGNARLMLHANGMPLVELVANKFRPDVATNLGASPDCGFEYVPSAALRREGSCVFRVVLLPYEIELTGSPLATTLLTDTQESALRDLTEEVDLLHRALTRVRRKLRMMAPRPGYTLAGYDEWARKYFDALRRRASRQRSLQARATARPAPLVSIVVPTYRPAMRDFIAAVESVMAQTYANWELIVVDDGSADATLSAQIEAFAMRDSRIRPLPQARNRGISAATNAGIAAARGDYVVFFDHDDLMVDVAVEMLVDAAGDGQAQMVYSDEDKIDAAGLLSEPAFKTGWNHRLLLSVNYVCHLLMVEREALGRAGPLDPAYDGAQDHDLLLRLAEVIPPDRIRHVPEVLYHWRKSETSTASATGAKPYAISAGQRAVADHLARRGLRARVESLGANTWYRVAWEFEQEPSVTIVVPYKDQIETTRRCVEGVLHGTRYGNHRLVLVDNWSTTEESRAFAEEMGRTDRVRVMRVEEPFNYSRLNNLAVQAYPAEYVVLLNNDLFHDDPLWLRKMIDECLADDQVAAVGGKFVYPNRTVQHAGVVLGIGGVAAHVHMGIGEGDPGYAARALFAQEMSAVTAACILVRSSVFWEVGGLDEEGLAVAFNDVDLCVKIRQAGYKIVWTPDVLSEHHESLSRGADDVVPAKETRFFHEMETMRERWGEVLLRDPYYSKHFDLDGRPFFDLRDPVESAGLA